MTDRQVKVVLSAQNAAYNRAMDEAAAKTRGVGSSLDDVKKREKALNDVAKGAMVVGGAMTALTLLVAKTGIEYNSLQQKSRAALTTLLGGAEAANAQMDKLDAFARTSPFAKQTFITAQQQMLAFGIEARKVVPYLDAIQDAVAAAGGSSQQLGEVAYIMAQIRSASKITGQDLIQFGQRGINAAELIGSAMGKTGGEIRAEITAGTLGANEALDALAEGMKTRFGGAAANVKNTFEGALDRVHAAWRDLSADLTKPLVNPEGGGALVDLLNWIADVTRGFQGLPEPIKLTTGAMFSATGAIALFGGTAVKLYPKMQKLWDQFMALSAGLRTVGWVSGGAVAALGVLVAIVSAVSAAQAAAMQRAQDYADSLDDVTHAVTGQTRELVKNELAFRSQVLWFQDPSIFDSAEKLGISLELVTDAALNGGDAMAELGRQLDEKRATFRGDSGDMAEYDETLRRVRDGVARVNGEIGSGVELAKQKAEADGGAADATSELADESDNAARALDDVARALDAVNRTALDLAEATDRAQGSLNDMAEAADAEGASLDGTNNASLRLNASMRDVEKSHRDAAKAILENGGSLEEARAEWERGREAVINQRVAMGESREEATRWADETLGSAQEIEQGLRDVKNAVDDIPDKKAITLTANTSDARSRVRDFIREYDGKVVRMTLQATQVVTAGRVYGGLRDGSYRGNLFNGMVAQHFASGGMRSGIYDAVPGGIFAEAEMGVPWESFISGRPQDRDRNIGIWQETGRMLGVGGDGTGVVELGPQSLRALSREVVNLINIDQESIGSAANAANAHRAFRGGGGLG